MARINTYVFCIVNDVFCVGEGVIFEQLFFFVYEGNELLDVDNQNNGYFFNSSGLWKKVHKLER